MQPSPLYKRPWAFPAVAIVGLVVVILLSNRPITTPEGLPIVFDEDTFAATLRDAATINTPRFEAYDRGDEISDADKVQLRKSARMLDSAINLHPNKAGLYLDAGRAYLIAEDYGTAELRFMQCLSNAALQGSDLPKEGLADTMYLLSVVKGRQGDWKSALNYATTADSTRPNVANYLAAKASAEMQLKQMDKAKADITKSLLIDSTNKHALQLKRLFEIDAQGR